MSATVCRNLVHCLESQQAETTTLKLKVAAAAPSAAKTVLEFGFWGCLQTAPNQQSIEKERNPYANDFARKSLFSTLTSKSLDLCTENLGSETGTDTISGGAALFSPPPSKPSDSGGNPSPREREVSKSPRIIPHEGDNSRRKIKNFPPPLTTMAGGVGLRVRRRRDGGRLIIEAVQAPARSSCLAAYRSDGRIRMRLLTDSDTAATVGEESEAEDECGGEKAEEEEEEINGPTSETESDEEEINLEMKIERIQSWLSRCNESRHGNRALCSDFKPALWVATS